MQFEGLRDVGFVRTVYTIMSCAPYILRSAFRLIGSREIFFSSPPLTKIIWCSSLFYRWYAFGWTESYKFSQNAFLFFADMHLSGLRTVRFVRIPSFVTLIMSCAIYIYIYYDRHLGWLEAVRFVSRSPLNKIIDWETWDLSECLPLLQ